MTTEQDDVVAPYLPPRRKVVSGKALQAKETVNASLTPTEYQDYKENLSKIMAEASKVRDWTDVGTPPQQQSVENRLLLAEMQSTNQLLRQMRGSQVDALTALSTIVTTLLETNELLKDLLDTIGD